MLPQLFLSFLKIGTFGYGSGPAMLILIEREMVGRELMTSEQFTSAVAMGTALPGPIATKMSLYCGYQAAGVPGALVALLGVILPSTLAMLLLAKFVMEFRGHPKLEGVLRAMKPVVVAIFLVLAINSARGAQVKVTQLLTVDEVDEGVSKAVVYHPPNR